MRIVAAFVTVLITTLLVYVLDHPIGKMPSPGSFFSPLHGFWQNAESVNADYNQEISFAEITATTGYKPKGKVMVCIDERLVPHVFADNEMDAYFVQGYLHARFRLWQMEFQIRAAAGRLSEVLGEGPEGKILQYDRGMRRLGMVYAAEQSLKAMHSNQNAQEQMDAYAAGVNGFINQLTPGELPLEYKLLNYKPEKWTPLSSALLLKYMSYDLAGGEEDLKFTNARTVFSKSDFEKLYPIFPDSLSPIIANTPENKYPDSAVVSMAPPADADSLYFTFKNDSNTAQLPQPDKDNGSNNWVVSGSRTISGRPILCNDPHLSLNFPSIWFEMQISTPEFSAYGVSFPGAPNIIIGFNEHIAFGFTNAGRDVKDYYQMRFRNASMDEYWFNGEWRKAQKRVEVYQVKGKTSIMDTVVYTHIGPVLYDRSYPASNNSDLMLAVRWKAHDPSCETALFYGLNHAKNYDDYQASLQHLTCPGQNCAFASRSGDIAIWQQGEFPAKWRRQGDFVMPGTDSSYMWRGYIPFEQNPHEKNPIRGFVSSANQMAIDSTYPYYLGNSFPMYRGLRVNQELARMNPVSVEDMKLLQNDNFNLKAATTRKIMLQLPDSLLTADENRFFGLYKGWDSRNEPHSIGATVFEIWWTALEKNVWGDELSQSGMELPWPEEFVLAESLLRDSGNYAFLDDIKTSQKETLSDCLLISFRKAVADLVKLEKENKLEWTAFKHSHIDHLIKIPWFSRNIESGGGVGIVNCIKEQHGPSWRMIVHLTDEIEAYGVYPGGQSGNPGSKYYDNFVDTWCKGQYYSLSLMKRLGDEERTRWKLLFQ